MSKYAEDMKQALMTYRDTKQKAEARYNEIKDLYGEEAVQREKERQEKQIKAARATAEAAIREAYSEGHYLAEQWGKPDGSQLTDDLKLFDAGMVTPEVFDHLKDKYKNNATMSAALKAKGEKLNAEARKEEQSKGNGFTMAEPYNTRDITTGEDRVKAWDSLKAKAMDTLDMIDGSGRYNDPWSRSIGAAMGEQIVEHFGEDM